MGREVRRVPEDWVHTPEMGPLHERSYAKDLETWEANKAAWERGEYPDYASEEAKALPFEEWEGARPDPDDYMPVWRPEERTHYQMYETTTEGTPISPVMESPEELARWLYENKASAFGSITASYEHWLTVCKMDGDTGVGLALTDSGEMISGVEFVARSEEKEKA